MLNDDELMEISEKMGATVHNAWMEKRKKERGWHNPKECPHKGKACAICKGTELFPIAGDIDEEDYFVICDDCQNKQKISDHYPCHKCHPCMKPYKDLPDSEKELDRQYPRLFLIILEEMGYSIVQKSE